MPRSKNRAPGVDRWTLSRTLQWCIIKYGHSKFQDTFPNFSLTSTVTHDMDGFYEPDENKIYINSRIKTARCAVSTMIHEYTHYKQNISEMYDRYYEVHGYNYDNHPYEVAARRIAMRDVDLCIRQTFKNKVTKKAVKKT